MVLCTMWPEKNVLNGIFFFSVSHSWAIVLANFLGGLSSAHLYGLMLTQSARQRHDAQQRQQQQQLSSSRGQHFSAVSQSFWCLLFFVCILLGCAVFFLSFFLVLLILFFWVAGQTHGSGNDGFAGVGCVAPSLSRGLLPSLSRIASADFTHFN